MKTLSYYQNLREDYACIIPKTAPAWELIEALDALIGLLPPNPPQPKEEQPHFLGVPVNLPLDWSIAINHESDTITLSDHRGVRRGSVYRKLNGDYAIWWDGKYVTTLKNQKDAIKWLNGKANDI